MFGKKRNKDEIKSGKPKTGQPSAKDGKPKTSQPAVKGSKPKTGQPAVKQKTQQDMSDKVRAKLMEIEKEARLEQSRDSVDGLEDEKIAEHIELLLKIMQSRE